MKYGIRSVSMDDIARQLSVSKKTLYQHFADKDELVTVMSQEHMKREVKELKERSSVSAEMIGKSPAINQLKSQIDRVAPTNSRILIRGSSGTGKELAARVLHQ